MILAGVLVVLAAADILTSLWGLTHGFPEAAPFMARLVALYGVGVIVPVKLALTVVVLALVERVTTRSRALAWTIALGLFALPAVSNFLLIQGA